MSGKVALVTGACSGIGLSLSTILASLGYTLILASNRDGYELRALEVRAARAATVSYFIVPPMPPNRWRRGPVQDH